MDCLASPLNAVAPYTWEAEYRDGTIVRQFDPVQGFQRSTVIDPQRIRAIRVLGGSRPIRLELPYPAAPDDVRIQRTTNLSLTMDSQIAGLSVVRWFGYRYGTEWFLLRIDDEGVARLTDRFD
jgi:hypothetical protein